MALRMDIKARSGDAEFLVTAAYLQARPTMDKATRNQVDESGQAVLVDGRPVPESYWYIKADLRWWRVLEDGTHERIRTDLEEMKIEINPADIQSNLIAELYGRLKKEPGFKKATDV